MAAPPRRLGRPTAADSAETRARILEAARQRFAESGYARARIQEIAADAGVTPTAVYHYFDSKKSLFAAAYAAALDVLLAAYHRAVAGEETTVDKLCAAFGANAELNRRHPALAGFLAIASLEARQDPELETALDPRGAGVADLFRSVLEEGVRRGEVDAAVSVDAVTHLLIAASYGLSWAHGLLPAAEDHEAVLGAFQQLLRGRVLASK